MQIWKNVVCLGLILTLTVAGVADEKKSAQKGKKAPAPTQRFLNGIELTAEQKDKVAALDKELSAEFQKLQKSRSEILTETQKTAEREAQKSAKAAGKTPAETRKSVEQAPLSFPDLFSVTQVVFKHREVYRLPKAPGPQYNLTHAT